MKAAMHAARLAMQVTVAVCVYAFDLLFADGEMLVHLPLRQRRIRMAQVRCCVPAHNAHAHRHTPPAIYAAALCRLSLTCDGAACSNAVSICP